MCGWYAVAHAAGCGGVHSPPSQPFSCSNVRYSRPKAQLLYNRPKSQLFHRVYPKAQLFRPEGSIFITRSRNCLAPEGSIVITRSRNYLAPEGSIVCTRSRNCFTFLPQGSNLFLHVPESSIVSTKAQSMESMVRSINDDSLEVTSSNKHHDIIGTLSKRVDYFMHFDGWHFWELFTGLEGVLSTVVSRGSTVQFPDQGTKLFTVACFLTPADGTNSIRLTIAEGKAGEFFIGGFVVGQELAMTVVSLKVVSGPQHDAFFKFMNKNQTPATIKQHRAAQPKPPGTASTEGTERFINKRFLGAEEAQVPHERQVPRKLARVAEVDPRLEVLRQQAAAEDRKHASRM